MTLTVHIEQKSGSFAENAKRVQQRQQRAISASANMLASMLLDAYRTDISGAGNFGGRWTSGMMTLTTVGVNRATIRSVHDIPYANVFEEGAEIKGGLLWIGISGTDAEGVPAKEYGGLFSPRKQRENGRPLLFSIADKQPKYFGIEAVTIPKKFHLADVQRSVLAGYRQMYEQAFKEA